MNISLEIRTFALQDVDQVIDLLQEISIYRPNPCDALQLAAAFLSQKDAYACVAAQGLRIVAFGSIFILNRVRGGCSAIIEDMVVDHSMRGQGVGGLVLEALLEHARERGCFKVSLESSDAGQEFYRTKGFYNAGQLLKLGL